MVYVADNNSDPRGNHHLTAFRVEPDGTLSNKQILFDFGPNRRGIDGMALDRDGNIYATAGQGEEAGVYVFDAAGKHLAMIRTPGTPTNCAFGGANEPAALYITAGVAAEENTPQRFGLYRIELAIAGE
jgi:gluconolactonase